MDAAASERVSARKGRRRPAGRVLPHQPLQTLSRLVTGTSQCLPGAMVLKSLKAMLSISGGDYLWSHQQQQAASLTTPSTRPCRGGGHLPS